MNEAEIAQWHREKAKTLQLRAELLLAESRTHLDMANRLAAPTGIPGPLPTPNRMQGQRKITIEEVRSYLRHKGGRTNHVAAHFGVPCEDIEAIVRTPGSGIMIAERGWLKLASDFYSPQAATTAAQS